MNLLIFEYFSGGTHSNKALSSNILSEAYAMLRSLISDCKASGHNVTTLMDSRLTKFNPPHQAERVVCVHNPNDASKKLKDISKLVDAVYIIAPESGETLEKLIESIENSCTISLNCEINGVKHVSNKMNTYTILKRNGLKVPETILFDTTENEVNIRNRIKELGYPLIFKPKSSVGCNGLSLIKHQKEILEAIKKLTRESLDSQFVAQNFVVGEPVSVSVISNGDKAIAISLNMQRTTLSSPNKESTYDGGEVPFNHPLEKKVYEVAERAVETFPGLKGYVGVDMILTKYGPVIVEINPRLTTSYIGLRKVASLSIPEMIIDAIVNKKLPTNFGTRGYSFFSKIAVPADPQILPETYKLTDVISPPFPIEEKMAYTLIASSSKSPRDAKTCFYRTKYSILSLYGD